MKSHVIRLHSCAGTQAPDEFRCWRVPDSEIEARLALLSGSHAREEDAEAIQAGDGVACRGESQAKRWDRPEILFYPGRGLCEKALEDALLGRKAGERVTVETADGEVTLTVLRAVRRKPHPIDDDLVKLEGIEGVETLEDHRRWYRETHEAKNREGSLMRVAYWQLDEIEKNSEFEIDEAELRDWGWAVVDQVYQNMVANGMDPTVPEEGTEFLTEEQARQQIYDQYAESTLREYLAMCAVVEQTGGQDLEKACQEGAEKMAEQYQKTVEELTELFGGERFLRRGVLQNLAVKLLKAGAEEFLED